MRGWQARRGWLGGWSSGHELAAGVLIQAVEDPAGDAERVVVGFAGQGEAADQHVQARRGGRVVAVVGQVGFVDDAADFFQRRVGGQAERLQGGLERAPALVMPERGTAQIERRGARGDGGGVGDEDELGAQVPAGAKVNLAAHTITFTSTTVHFSVLADPAGGPDETFRIAGLVNPTITVPAGAHVSIQVVNADQDTAHGLVVTASSAQDSWMPMMTAAPAFRGAALWFLGDPTAAGMHAGTLAFTASTPGTYRYLCPVPGHAQQGMSGTFIVTHAP